MALIGSIFDDKIHMKQFRLSDNVRKLLETSEYKDGLLAIRAKLNEGKGFENK